MANTLGNINGTKSVPIEAKVFIYQKKEELSRAELLDYCNKHFDYNFTSASIAGLIRRLNCEEDCYRTRGRPKGSQELTLDEKQFVCDLLMQWENLPITPKDAKYISDTIYEKIGKRTTQPSWDLTLSQMGYQRYTNVNHQTRDYSELSLTDCKIKSVVGMTLEFECLRCNTTYKRQKINVTKGGCMYCPPLGADDYCELYLLNFTDFGKVGISVNYEKVRKPSFPKHEAVLVIGDKYSKIKKLESDMLDKIKEQNIQVKPAILKGNGSTECFDINYLETVKKWIETCK